MNNYPVPDNERERIKRLELLDLLNLSKDPQLDIFTETARLISGCQISFIAIMESETHKIKSCIGASMDVLDRKDAICHYPVATGQTVIIQDTLLDDRSSGNAVVIEAGIRFYAGIPLIDEEGFALGTLCVLNNEPKTLSEEQIATLKKLGNAVTKLLIAKRKNIQAEYFQQIFDVSHNPICVLNEKLVLKEINPAFEEAFRIKRNRIAATHFLEILGDQPNEVKEKIERFLENDGELMITTSSKIDGSQKVIIEWYMKRNHNDSEIFCFGTNITQFIEEKLQLENSEQRFRRFFENAIGLMSMHDMEGNILEVNKKGREILHYSEEEVEGLNLRDLVPEKNQKNLQEYLQYINQNKEHLGTMVLKTKEGEELIWMYHNRVELNKEGNPYVLSTALNITERMLLEKDLLYTKKILEQTSAAAQVGGWEVNLKNQSVFWSQTTKEIHKVAPDYQPEFQEAVRFYREEDRDKVGVLFNKAVSEGIGYDEEFQLVRQDGVMIWVRVKAIPEFDNGVCNRVFGIIQDIDAFKKIYLELSKKEAMLQSFVAYAPVAVAMFDKNLHYLSASNCWREEFGINDQELVGKNIFTISPNVSNEIQTIYRDAIRGKAYHNEDFKLITDHREEQHYNLEVRPWYLSDGVIGGVIVSVQNITQKVKTNNELKEAKKMADIASKAKSEFLANMSHEIRTPLNGVIGFSDLLLKTPLNETQKQYLNYINESGENLLTIINDILDFSKIESGKMELVIEKCNVYDLVNQVINVILYQSQKKNIELLLNIEPGLPKTLWIDESRMKQILINLLGNAVKFTDQGEIELKVEKLKIDGEKITLRFAVRDTGVGIAKEKQQYIFNAFTQENSSISKRYGGTGLGLTISNNILGYMGTHLELNSILNKGSVFYFDIEVSYELSEANGDEELKIKRALVVDDNEANRIILQHMLAYKNIDSKLAANGMEALQILLAGERFDIILMDYHMPVISGLETIEKIKALFSTQDETSPLVILHTSSEEHDVINSFRQEENSYFLLKPIKSEELYKTLRKAVDNNGKELPGTASQNTEETVLKIPELQVLLVDDNPVNMILNHKMVTSLIPDVQLTEAVNGLEAWEKCQNRDFSLILMDVQMPVMDGMEATTKIRQLPGYAEVPIIGVTAGTIAGEKEKCLASGMDDFLPKPLRQADLLEMLRKYLTRQDENTPNTTSTEGYLDMNLLHEQTGDDEDFKQMFLNLVTSELRQAEDGIRSAVAEKNTGELGKILHKLRGTAGTAGLVKLAETALRWEAKKDQHIDFLSMQQEITGEIANGLNAIKSLTK